AHYVACCPDCGDSHPGSQIAMAQSEWAAPPQNSNNARASLICGVILCFAPASIAAVILGHLALSDIKRSAGRISGHGMALAGLVMGYVGVALTVIFALAVVFSVRNALRYSVPR